MFELDFMSTAYLSAAYERPSQAPKGSAAQIPRSGNGSTSKMKLKELTEYIFDTYSIEPDHPFKMDDVTSVFRHAGSRKWFALTMNIPCRTLGIHREGNVDILNIKCDPLVIGSLRGRPGFCPAYHMNKDKWITILLDGSAPREDIVFLLAMSYDLTNSNIKRKKTDTQEEQ